MGAEWHLFCLLYTSDKKPEQTEEIKQPETLAEVVPTSETVATSLFTELETEKPKEEVMDLSPRPFNGLLEPHHRDGSMVLDLSLIHI